MILDNIWTLNIWINCKLYLVTEWIIIFLRYFSEEFYTRIGLLRKHKNISEEQITSYYLWLPHVEPLLSECALPTFRSTAAICLHHIISIGLINHVYNLTTFYFLLNSYCMLKWVTGILENILNCFAYCKHIFSNLFLPNANAFYNLSHSIWWPRKLQLRAFFSLSFAMLGNLFLSYAHAISFCIL